MVWRGEVFKAVTFPGGGEFDAAALWKAVANAEPPNVQRSQLPPQLRSVATGAWGDIFLQIAVQVGRVEAAVTAIDPAPSEPTPMPELAPEAIKGAIQSARRVGQVFAEQIPSLRIAAHVQLVQDAASELEATKRLNEILGDVFPPTTTSQLYQVNSPKPLLTIKGQMNRLIKWGSLSLKQLTVSVSGGMASQSATSKQRDLVYMHTDINSLALESAMSSEDAAKLTSEIWDETENVISGGPGALA